MQGNQPKIVKSRDTGKTAAERKAAALSKKRRAASAKGVAARWGESRGASRQVRVDESAFDALQRIPEKDRRRVATAGIVSQVEIYELFKGKKHIEYLAEYWKKKPLLGNAPIMSPDGESFIDAAGHKWTRKRKQPVSN